MTKEPNDSANAGRPRYDREAFAVALLMKAQPCDLCGGQTSLMYGTWLFEEGESDRSKPFAVVCIGEHEGFPTWLEALVHAHMNKPLPEAPDETA